MILKIEINNFNREESIIFNFQRGINDLEYRERDIEDLLSILTILRNPTNQFSERLLGNLKDEITIVTIIFTKDGKSIYEYSISCLPEKYLMESLIKDGVLVSYWDFSGLAELNGNNIEIFAKEMPTIPHMLVGLRGYDDQLSDFGKAICEELVNVYTLPDFSLFMLENKQINIQDIVYFYKNTYPKIEPFKYWNDILPKLDLNISGITKQGEIVTNGNFNIKFSDTGSGAMRMIYIIPLLFESMKSNNGIFIYPGFCENLHMLLIKFLLETWSKITVDNPEKNCLNQFISKLPAEYDKYFKLNIYRYNDKNK